MNARYTQLCQWLTQVTHIHQPDLSMVAGDASFRRYYRLTTPSHENNPGESPANLSPETCYIVMDAPPPEEDCAPFVHIAQHWFRQGVQVPEIMAQDTDQGFLVLEDFGDNPLLSNLVHPTHQPPPTQETVSEAASSKTETLYQNAADALIHIQQTSEPELPDYDHRLLMQEMSLFKEWFCRQWLALYLSQEEISLLDHTFEYLCHSALQQTQVPVHRDYHSRNLMLMSDDRIGIIDFQDAVQGPITYDLVSLLKDCYIHWPATDVTRWRDYYLKTAKTAGLLPVDYSREKFRQEFDLMGAQRHIKVLGIFCRLWLRDGKSGYLADIPRTLQHLLEATGEYQNLNPFHQFLLTRVVPALNKKQRSAGATAQYTGEDIACRQ